ncbi:MAG: DUF58 domain-containing protein [Luteolibacter sp.]
MTHDDLQRCHARATAAAARFRLPLRSRVWRGQAGEFTGSGSGSSMDFQDHRAYSPGDDPRHINWNAYARTESYTMKLYREEVRPMVDVILDASESMFFDEKKATRVAELFYFLAESSIASGAAVTLHAVRGDALVTLDTASVRNHRWLETVRQLPATSATAQPDLSRLPLRANSIRVFLSDLLFPGEPTDLLRPLGQRHGTRILFSPYLNSEAAPDWSGNYEFIDAETHNRHPHRIEPPILRRYLEAYTHHFALWKNAAIQHQTAFARIPVEEELSATLFREALAAGALESTR